MKVLFVASELNPIVKTGGLADVISSLPKELVQRGHDIRIALPDYPVIDNKQLKYIDQPRIFTITLPSGSVDCWVSQVLHPDIEVPIYLFKTSKGLQRHELYPEGGSDEQERFLLFGQAVVEWLKTSAWQPDIVHCHDWMTGAMPSLIKKNKLGYRTLFTIHNIFYQGVIDAQSLRDSGIPVSTTGSKVNLLRLGITTADYVNTVSPTYAKEAMTLEYGFGLEQALKRRKESFEGILNGIDYTIYSPEDNKRIAVQYTIKDFDLGKSHNKQKLLKDLGLEFDDRKPLYGFVGRLTDQKGLDLIDAAIQSTPMLEHGQLIVLGQGDGYWERRFTVLASARSRAMVTVIKFDEELAHQIYAASDFFLIPSRFEPCGLTQLIAMRFGSLPIARSTGGLVDTVVDQRHDPKNGNGIIFNGYTAKEFSQALGASVGLFRNQAKMKRAIKNAMTQDYSWAISAEKYIELYERLLD